MSFKIQATHFDFEANTKRQHIYIYIKKYFYFFRHNHTINVIKTTEHTSQVTFIYIALLTIQIVTALHNIKIGKLCQ